MVFSSAIFLTFFFPLIFLLHYTSSTKYRNRILIAASIFFYAWSAPNFIWILLTLTAVDYFLTKKMHEITYQKRKRELLIASICINLGILIYFKYFNFFIENINVILTQWSLNGVEVTKIILPIGISFFCFETLTYSIDIYSGRVKPLEKLSDYYLYIFFFPKLIAGPIVRFQLIENYIPGPNRILNHQNIIEGFGRFVIGLAKKILIANTLGQFVDANIGSDSALINGMAISTAWLTIISYSFQIYFDFSGYSDMALGLAKMFGFSLPENFDNPYTSKSITEFWRKWHITLGNWMCEYLYIPLGGNRGGKLKMITNLWLVFLVSGLWHGASWNFVIWGAYHGLFLVADRFFLEKLLLRFGSFVSTIFTFIVVLIGWVFFRIESLDTAMIFLSRMFTFNIGDSQLFISSEFWVTIIFAAICSFATSNKYGKKFENLIYYKNNHCCPTKI